MNFFHWMGIIFTGVFGLIGFCITIGLLADHCWQKMQNAYGLAEIMVAYKKYNKDKATKGITEGKIVKGGYNEAPTRQRPKPPKGKG